jgi:hypothetical protein
LLDNIHPDILGVRKWRTSVMPDQKSQPESAEKKGREIELRDLKPNTDPKGGAAKDKKDDKRSSGRKGEADFMKGLK